MVELVTFGETMALLTNPRLGPLRHAATLEVGIAGAESNTAIGVRRLGVPAGWMGRVGRDEFGRMVLSRVRGEGVEVDGATVDPEAPTGVMIKSTRAAGATEVTYYRRDSAASRLTPEDLDEDRVRAAAVLHVTGITAALSPSARETVLTAVETARAAGTTVSFDPNYRAALWGADEAAHWFRELAARADVVLAGQDEAAMMHGGGEPGTLARRLHASGVAQAVVKRGAEGAVAYIDDEPYRIDPVEVDVVDPVGAGDGFAAGYLAALVEGRSARERLDLAALVGAFAVTVAGDWEGLPTRDELDLLTGEGPDVTR